MSLIRNNSLTVGHIRKSHAIYRSPLPQIQGWTRYQETPRVKGVDIVQIRKELFNNLQDVILRVNFCDVNGVAIFDSVSKKIGYITVSFPMSRSTTSIVEEIKKN